MSGDGSIEITWGDGEHRFRTGLKEWREIQEKCDAGLIEIWDRLMARKWRVDDVREVIRVGLIGGGKTPTEALTLVKRYVEDRPLLESVPVAIAVLMAACAGMPGDDVGKAPAERDGQGASLSRPSTEQAPPSASVQ